MDIIAFDHAFFTWVNNDLSNPVLDALMPFFREKLFWAPGYLFVAAFALCNFGRKGWWVILGIVLTVAMADTVSSRLVKYSVQRVRPCNELGFQETVLLRVDGCGAGYSFTSSHACNHFALAIFLIGVLGRYGRWLRPSLLLWAGMIAFAQVYVGVHFPGDVIGGAILGITLSMMLRRLGLVKWIERQIFS